MLLSACGVRGVVAEWKIFPRLEGELFTQLEVGRRLGYVSAKDLEKPFDDLSEIGRMLNGLIASLEIKLEIKHSTFLIPDT